MNKFSSHKNNEGVIENCVFSYRCPKTWDSLLATDLPNIRLCLECENPVFFCNSEDEIQEHIELKHCIAVKIRGEERVLLGEPTNDYSLPK